MGRTPRRHSRDPARHGQAESVCLIVIHQEQGDGPIGHLARVADRDRSPAAVKIRLEPPEGLERLVLPWPDVLGDGIGTLLGVKGHDLIVQPAFAPGGDSPLMAPQGKEALARG